MNRKREQKNKSIKKVLRAHYIAIAVIMMAAIVAMLMFSLEITGTYNEILETNVHFNDYMMALNDTYEELEAVVLYEDTEREDSYYASTERLFIEADCLADKERTSESWRYTEDLKHMTASFESEASSSVRLMIAGFPSAAIPNFETARNLYNLTTTYYSRSYNRLIAVMKDDIQSANAYRNELFMISLSVSIWLFVLSFVVAHHYSEKVVRPIEKLKSEVSKVVIYEQQLQSIDKNVGIISEVYELAGVYNTFIRRINEQFLQIKEKRELEVKLHQEETKMLKVVNMLKESELKALQSRIKPHFLFNSLNMISSVALLEGAEKTTELMGALGSCLRYNLDNFNNTVTIKDEIENVSDYIAIQRIRLGERLRFEIQSDPKSDNARIPCLIIQPMIENSIIHGLGNHLENGFVCVNIKRQADRVYISVRDNGVGIDKNMLKKLRDLQYQDELFNDNTKSIGLRNVISRLKLFYDNMIDIHINSEKDAGTEILLIIPFWVKETVNEL